MTRAEEAAMKVFPVNKVPYYGLACSAVSERDANSDKRALYRMGYEQAEKELALTWEDVQLLDLFALECQTEESKGRKFNSSQEFFEEVLRRFNETRNG